jgi:hypothetical protein
MSLTGRFNFRKSLGGKIILQVEEETRPFWSFPRAAMSAPGGAMRARSIWRCRR